VLNMWPCKKIFLKSYWFIYLFMYFSNPTHKTKAGTAKRWAVLSMWPCKKYFSHPRKYTLLCQVLGFAVPHYQPRAECAKLLGPKPFCWAKLACFVVVLLLL
jgi:hypothetical protein